MMTASRASRLHRRADLRAAGPEPPTANPTAELRCAQCGREQREGERGWGGLQAQEPDDNIRVEARKEPSPNEDRTEAGLIVVVLAVAAR
jgi:hypothetical protein